MAAARRRHRLKAPVRRDPLALRALRGLAGLSLAGLGGLVAYEGLQSAGFQFRWEVDDPSGPPPRSTFDSPSPSPSPVPTPEGGASRVDTDRHPVGEFASIDFETFPGGRSVCTNCAVSDEWGDEGLVVSFHSWTADSSRPSVLDARNFLPADASKHALGPALSGERGLEVGVVRLDFPGRPRRVAFTLYGPDLIDSFSVVAWSDGEELPPSAQTRSLERKYNPAGRARFRAERILVEAPRGVDRVALDGWGPPGHVLLVDDLAIDP